MHLYNGVRGFISKGQDTPQLWKGLILLGDFDLDAGGSLRISSRHLPILGYLKRSH